MTKMTDCHSMDDVRRAFGTNCRVIGRYDLESVLDAKGKTMAHWPVVRLRNGEGAVLIESIWDSSKRHGEVTIAELMGKQVAVTGRLHASPPGRIANMAFPCISPVEKIETESQE